MKIPKYVTAKTIRLSMQRTKQYNEKYYEEQLWLMGYNYAIRKMIELNKNNKNQ